MFQRGNDVGVYRQPIEPNDAYRKKARHDDTAERFAAALGTYGVYIDRRRHTAALTRYCAGARLLYT